jgi:predicted transposase YbfD/YdcC
MELKHGAPSHDTFSRLFRLLDPDQFRACFQRFMASFAEACQGVVAIDGKVLRRSFDTASRKSALPMVSAWACEPQLVLAQIATGEKSNEIKAIPKLLRLISLRGSSVTVDALNCQRAIAQQIVDQEGDSVMALKGNQQSLHDDVRRCFEDAQSTVETAKPAVDGDHGRIETRIATVSTDIDWLKETHRWPGLGAIGKMDRIRENGGKNPHRDGLLSPEFPADARTFRRGHPLPLGGSRTDCIGGSMSAWARINSATGSTTAPIIWPCFATWRSISSPRTNPRDPCRKSFAAPHSMTPSSLRSSLR